MSKLSSRLLAASALLALLLIAAGPAAAWDPNPTFPRKGIPYYCNWKFVDGPHKNVSGTSVLVFNEVVCNKLPDGNSLCRPVSARTTYPDGGFRDTTITIAKPSSCGPRCSKSEFTVDRPEPSIQCKDFRAEVVPGGGWGMPPQFHLDFRQCNNYVEQSCKFPPG